MNVYLKLLLTHTSKRYYTIGVQVLHTQTHKYYILSDTMYTHLPHSHNDTTHTHTQMVAPPREGYSIYGFYTHSKIPQTDIINKYYS